MALGDVDLGTTFMSFLYGDVTRPEYLTFTPNWEFIPEEIAPLHKQMRIFLQGQEMAYLDDRLISPPTDDYYTYTTLAPTAGVRCWGIRYTCDAISEFSNDEQGTALVTIYDQDDNAILWDETWKSSLDDGESHHDADAVLHDNSFNTNPAQGTTEAIEDVRVYVVTNFPRAMDINRIGWTRAHTNAGDQTWENVKVEVNVGTPGNANWIVFGDSTLHTVQNVASAHTPGADSLALVNYPALQDPIVRGTDDIWFDWTTNHTTARDLDNPVPVITCVSSAYEPSATSHRSLIMRETRQDAPWVKPQPGARAYGYGLWWYFEQIRFIVQELCELDAVSNFLGLPPASQEKNDYTGGNQSVEYDATAEDTFDYTSIELLQYAPAGSITPQDQLEVATASTSAGPWTVLTYTASPSDNTQWNIVGDNVVLGGTTSLQVRIRRVTRTDQYWFDLRGVQGAWNTAAVDMVQKQARFMIEESCYLPQFYNESPLSQSIFPRGWNWFTFVGTRNQWTIPGGVWGGNGVVVVYVNNVEQTEGVDYTIEGPTIVWTGTPPSGTTTIGVGGGGFGFGGLGGGDDDEEVDDNVVPPPGTEAPPIDWPPNNLAPDCGVSLSIGAKAQTALATGDWEGATAVDFSQGNGTSESQFGSSPMRIQVTVTTANKVSDGAGGFHNVGATDVLYINKICNPTGSNTLYAVAAAWHDGDGIWGSDEGSAALGCLSPGGASGGYGLWALAGCGDNVSSTSPPEWRLYDSLNNITGAIAGGDIDQVPYMNQYKELLEQADNAAAEGWVSETGFTSAQFQSFVDPDEVLSDFDDPGP